VTPVAPEAPAKKKGGRPKAAAPKERASRFYIELSSEGLALLRDMTEPRGGFNRAKTAVLEEAIRRMHAVDVMVPKRKRQKVEEP
jgi:hypothetical protein